MMWPCQPGRVCVLLKGCVELGLSTGKPQPSAAATLTNEPCSRPWQWKVQREMGELGQRLRRGVAASWGIKHIERKTPRFKGTCTEMILLRHMSFAPFSRTIYGCKKAKQTKYHQNWPSQASGLHPSSWQLLHTPTKPSPAEGAKRLEEKGWWEQA